MTLRERPFGDTSNAATVAVTKRDVSLLMEKVKNIFSNYTEKKTDRVFPVPRRDVTTKLSLGGNNDVITELFLPSGSLVSDIPSGDGKLVNLFLLCSSVTPRVDTATVAVSDVSLYGLSRNVKYRNLYLLPRNLYLLPLTVKVAQHLNAPSSFW